MTTLIALIGAKALLLMYLWLIGAALSSYMSERKGYGDKPGLATGLLLSILGVIVWLIVPAKAESKWKVLGVYGTDKKVRPSA
jgi:hypothetical protein